MITLRQAASDYLAMRRALGYKLREQGHLLTQFIDYLEHVGAQTITVDLGVAWARQPATANPAWWANRLSVVRGFARHLQTLDPATEVPPADLLPCAYRRQIPHLFTENEITAIVRAAHCLAVPLLAASLHALIGLLAVTGIRVGEAVALGHDHVGLDTATLEIVKAKRGTSRRLSLHPTTVTVLRDYARRRDDLLGPGRITSTFFVSATGGRLTVSAVDNTFARMLYHAGIQPVPGRRPPRVHDVRHSFAVATLVAWYRTGVDVQARLPHLSTWLGHVAPSSTYWYLQAAPELLALAAQRLNQDNQEEP
jgi:site-specific recombinase XerD